MALNDTSTALSLLQTRRSGKPRDLGEPGPSVDEIEQILTIAMRTPDHGKLAPWRFVVVGAEQRGQLADLFRRALQAEDPEANPAHHAKAQQFAHQAPVMIALISSPVRDHKIPLWEQQLSCGAVAMNLLHAAHALGYVGSWITGWQAYSPTVRSAFCKEGEAIAGFIFLGTPGAPVEERPRPTLATHVRIWSPPIA